jgi:NADH-quinone oxidoreductase subunit J
MTLFASDAATPVAPQLILAVALAAAGVGLLLPRPRGRRVAVGTFLSLAGFAILGVSLATAFGEPNLTKVESLLFWLFATGAVGFGTVLVTQKNPARGAIAFAFVIVSVCGLFLLLAAPFLMAATIVVYAGAIIVTFLFVLMLSHSGGPSDENDRSREPLLGSLAGFAFTGLLLFGLLHAADANATLPQPPLSSGDKATLADILARLDRAPAGGPATAIVKATDGPRMDLDLLVQKVEGRVYFLGTSPPPPWDATFARLGKVRAASKALENAVTQTPAEADRALETVRAETRLLLGSAELPARNVGTIGLLLYSEHLLAVEMAGTLLLVAAIGAVAVVGRRETPGKAVPA